MWFKYGLKTQKLLALSLIHILSTAAGYEVELGVIAKVLELLTRLPLNLHAGDVLCGELVGILGTRCV